MTVNTDQPIYKDAEFPRNVTFQNIVTDSVNGIDLSQQAVINSRKNNFFLETRGRKTFTRDLKVSSITLKEGVVIDSFDPSDFQILETHDVDAWSTFSFESGTIGNINATDVEINVNYFPQLKIFDNVWLRTTGQVIIFKYN